MSGKTGTWINLPTGLREALDLSLAASEDSRTKWVQKLIEDAVIDKLENLDYDVGIVLDNIHPNKDMRIHYKALVKSVHDRRNPIIEKPVEPVDNDAESPNLNSEILKSIAESN